MPFFLLRIQNNNESMKRYPYSGFILLFALVIGCLSVSYGQNDENTVVARVNNAAITRKELAERVHLTINRTYFHKNLTPERERQIRKQSLQALIEEELLFQEALKQEIEVDKKEVERRYQDIVNRFPTKAEFKKALKESGYTSREYRKKLEREFLIQEVYKRNVTDQIVLTEASLADYYQGNKFKFKKPETVNVQLIFIKIKDPTADISRQEARQKAESLSIRLKKGEDFAGLASQYSDDMYRIKGGHLGEVHRGRLPKEIEATAFSMKPGEISPPIMTEKGYSIIKLLDKKVSRQLEFGEIKDKLKKDLEKKRMADTRDKWLNRLKAEAHIDIHLDNQ